MVSSSFESTWFDEYLSGFQLVFSPMSVRKSTWAVWVGTGVGTYCVGANGANPFPVFPGRRTPPLKILYLNPVLEWIAALSGARLELLHWEDYVEQPLRWAGQWSPGKEFLCLGLSDGA